MFRFAGSKKEESQFDKEWNEYRETVEEVRSLQKTMRAHIQLTKDHIGSAATLGIQLASFYQKTDGASRSRAYGQLHAELERIQLASVERLFNEEVETPANVLLLQYPEVAAEVKARKKLIQDAQNKRKKYENKKQELAELAQSNANNQNSGRPKRGNGMLGAVGVGRRRKSESEVAKEVSERKQKYDDTLKELNYMTESLQLKFAQMRERKSKGEILEGPVSGLVACQYHLSREGAKRVERIRKLFQSNDVYLRTLQRYDYDLIKGIAHVQDLGMADGLEFGRMLKSSTPIVVCDCIAYIKQGLDTEGLFRIPGNRANVKTLQSEYDKGETGVLNKHPEIDIHDVCSLLKHYFGCMPEPLIPYENYEQLLAVMQNASRYTKEALLDSIVGITQEIKGSRKGLLGLLLNFLHDVAKYRQMNQMTPTNLATCMVPVICRTRDTGNPSAAIMNLAPSIAVVTLLIDNARRLPVPTEDSINQNTKVDIEALKKKMKEYNMTAQQTGHNQNQDYMATLDHHAKIAARGADTFNQYRGDEAEPDEPTNVNIDEEIERTAAQMSMEIRMQLAKGDETGSFSIAPTASINSRTTQLDPEVLGGNTSGSNAQGHKGSYTRKPKGNSAMIRKRSENPGTPRIGQDFIGDGSNLSGVTNGQGSNINGNQNSGPPGMEEVGMGSRLNNGNPNLNGASKESLDI